LLEHDVEKSLTVTATDPANTDLTQTLSGVIVTAGPPAILVIDDYPMSLVAGTCSPLVASLYDHVGTATNTNTNFAVGLSSPGKVKFYSDATCKTQINSTTILAKEHSVGFYVEDLTVERAPLVTTDTGRALVCDAPVSSSVGSSGSAGNTSGGGSDSSSGCAQSPPLPVYFLPGAGYAGVQVVPVLSGTVLANACHPVELMAVDAMRHSIALNVPLPIGLSSTSTSAEYYRDAKCTQPLIGLTLPNPPGVLTSFYFRDKVQETSTLTLSDPFGAVASGKATFSSPGANVAGSQADWTNVLGVRYSGGCYGPITVTIVDANGAPSPISSPYSFNLDGTTSGIGNFGFFSDKLCQEPSSQISFAPGTSHEAFYVRANGKFPGQPILQVIDPKGLFPTLTQAVVVQP
jgi:hypothetical protein